MPDTSAERQRRYRRHKQGDHSLCDRARCDAAGDGDAVVEPVTRNDSPGVTEDDHRPGRIESGVSSLVVSLRFPDGDPRRILGDVAVQLARRVDESGAAPAAARELRVLLTQLVEVPEQASGPVDEIRARRAQRRLDELLAAAS